MNVSVHYLAQLRQIAGRSSERVNLPASSTVMQLIHFISERNERLGGVLLDAQGQIQPTILIFLGDEQVSRTHTLDDGDEVTLMTPIAGGM